MEISEIFLSIQGEGVDIGLPTVFVRTSKCNLQCGWCDTKYSWEPGEERTIESIMEEVLSYGMDRVCISGGEPMLQAEEVTKLVSMLEAKGVEVTIETNGSIDLDDITRGDLTRFCMDLKCPSSGMQDRNLFTNLTKLRSNDVLKFVIAHLEDYIFARKMLERNTPDCMVVFQPVGGLDLRDLAERVLEDRLDVRVLLQLHRYIWGDQRGV
jgi:7-carboxy-7-deazaguanine synthase